MPYGLIIWDTFHDYPLVNLVLIGIGLLSQIFFFAIEIIQFKVQGKTYFGFLNVCDALQIICYGVHIVLKYWERIQKNGLESLVSNEDHSHENDDGKDLEIWLILSEVVMLLLIFFKI